MLLSPSVHWVGAAVPNCCGVALLSPHGWCCLLLPPFGWWCFPLPGGDDNFLNLRRDRQQTQMRKGVPQGEEVKAAPLQGGGGGEAPPKGGADQEAPPKRGEGASTSTQKEEKQAPHKRRRGEGSTTQKGKQLLTNEEWDSSPYKRREEGPPHDFASLLRWAGPALSSPPLGWWNV